MKNEVGLKLISMELGVSITTVSRALRDCSDISESMKAKVREKAVELKYTPNVLARSLVTGKSNFICVVVDSMKSPFFSVIVDELSVKLKNRGYNVCLLPVSNRFLERNNVKEAASIGAAAIISFLAPHKDAVEYAILLDKPLLIFGRGCEEQMVNKIYTDDIRGGEIAAEYLHKLGHKKLMYVGAEIHEVSGIRQRGFISKAKELGIDDIVVSQNDENEMFNYIKEGYKGIFCFDDQLVMQILSKVPQSEIDVVGFNGLFKNFAFNYYFSFPSISSNYSNMTDDAVNILIEQINTDGNYKYFDKKYDVEIV